MPPTARKTTTKSTMDTTPAAPAAPVEDKYAPTAWGSSESPLQDLTVPSGQTCLVRRPGVEGLLVEGLLFETDFLSTIIHDNVVLAEKGIEAKPVDLEKITQDPKKLAELFRTVDKIVCAVVVKPHVKRPPDNMLNRQAGVVYTDMIDMADKMFIVDFAIGGSSDLDSFLAQPSPGVGGVQNRARSSVPAKRTPRNR